MGCNAGGISHQERETLYQIRLNSHSICRGGAPGSAPGAPHTNRHTNRGNHAREKPQGKRI
ncbi:MAG: hypothetical protein F6J93_36690 [Oscillatoria sp. SIO1A7]|nr:hypothetical protein [Oscillatoria sp. SIO1A7]